jgi:hypothetical protein
MQHSENHGIVENTVRTVLPNVTSIQTDQHFAQNITALS